MDNIHIFFAQLAWDLLVIILMMRPIIDILDWQFLKSFLLWRKYLGIACGLSAILHAFTYLYSRGLLANYFSDPAFWRLNNLFGWGSFALAFLFIPFITSNRFSQRLLKRNWKRLQRFAYLAFVFVGVHVSFSEGEFGEGLLPVLIWAALWTWAYRKKKNNNLVVNLNN